MLKVEDQPRPGKEQMADDAVAGGDDRARLDAAIVAEQIRLLTKKRLDLPINLLIAGLVSATLWPLYPPWVAFSWLGLFCCVIFARPFLRRRFLTVPPGAETAQRWGPLFTLNAFETACLWGLTGSVILVTPDPIYQVFIVFVIGGMMAGGVVSFAAYMPAMVAFMLPAMLPAIAALVIRGGTVQIEMAVMLAVFTVTMTMTGRDINRSIMENVRLRLEQDFVLSKLRASESTMVDAQAMAHIGTWDIDVRDNSEVWSTETYRIFGVDPVTFEPSYKSMAARVYPADRPAVGKDFAEVVATGTSPGIDHRIVMDDGEIKYVRETARATYDIAGRPLRINGIVQDITERKQGEIAKSLLAAIVESSVDAIVGETVTGVITSWNPAAERLYGYRAEEVIGLDVRLLVPDERREEVERYLATLARGERVQPFDTERMKKDGTLIPVSIAASSIRDTAGNVVGGSFISRDITERRSAEDKLEFANILLKTQMEASLDGILIVDANLRIISFNQRFSDIWNIPLTDLLAGSDPAVLAKVTASVCEKDRERFLARVKYLYDHPGEDSHDEFDSTDGMSIDRYTATLYAPTGECLGRAWFFRDITERKRAEALALRMARCDVLTGLANRAVFVEALEHAIATAKRGEKSFAILYLDLDRFKDVNDTLGHPVGDELLKLVAERLRANTRETDTVARFGGDEFAIIVADIKDPADAAMLADKLITALTFPFLVQTSEIHSGASIGIAPYGAETPDPETLLSHADVALYRAKSEGRGGYRFFTDAMDSEVQMRVALGAELRVAVDSDQLFLMYQPQVEIDSGRITGVEALVRWRHPARGLLGPGLFIPIAEQIGIIAKVGHWVLWEACRQGKVWLDAGIAPIRISVNLSALQFRTPVVLEADIADALEQTGMPPQMLELELTESVLMDASRENIDLLQRLRKSGVTIAIDDFGTGYSSLDYLRRYPSNRIKIAQNFVANLKTTPGDAAIIRATIGLARELEIDVIAEGVETQEQCDLLKEWGCGEVQGFHFARPLAVEDATAILRDGKVLPACASTASAYS